MGRGWREEEAAAVLELMSACQIRNTMHLRQRFTEKKKIGRGWRERKKQRESETDINMIDR